MKEAVHAHQVINDVSASEKAINVVRTALHGLTISDSIVILASVLGDLAIQSQESDTIVGVTFNGEEVIAVDASERNYREGGIQ